jgi:hypothetical protein
MAKGKKAPKVKGRKYYSTEMGGKWFDPLKGKQTVEGEYVRSFETASKFKNMREGSNCFGKKLKENYEILLDSGDKVNFSEGGGPIQALFDDMKPGDRLHIEFIGLEREDGVMVPASIKTREQLNKWKGGKKVRCFPRYAPKGVYLN